MTGLGQPCIASKDSDRHLVIGRGPPLRHPGQRQTPRCRRQPQKPPLRRLRIARLRIAGSSANCWTMPGTARHISAERALRRSGRLISSQPVAPARKTCELRCGGGNRDCSVLHRFNWASSNFAAAATYVRLIFSASEFGSRWESRHDHVNRERSRSSPLSIRSGTASGKRPKR